MDEKYDLQILYNYINIKVPAEKSQRWFQDILIQPIILITWIDNDLATFENTAKSWLFLVYRNRWQLKMNLFTSLVSFTKVFTTVILLF